MCGMTVTYLRGGLSACSVVWLPVKNFFLKFIKILVQLCENFFSKLQEPRLIPSYPGAVYAFALLFLSAAQLRLFETLSFGLEMMISNIFSSNLSDLTS